MKAKLTKRVFNSPLIMFANFKDGSHINLIRLLRPYANGYAYAIHETTKSAMCSDRMFRSLDKARHAFECMVLAGQRECPLTGRGEIHDNF